MQPQEREESLGIASMPRRVAALDIGVFVVFVGAYFLVQGVSSRGRWFPEMVAIGGMVLSGLKIALSVWATRGGSHGPPGLEESEAFREEERSRPELDIEGIEPGDVDEDDHDDGRKLKLKLESSLRPRPAYHWWAWLLSLAAISWLIGVRVGGMIWALTFFAIETKVKWTKRILFLAVFVVLVTMLELLADIEWPPGYFDPWPW